MAERWQERLGSLIRQYRGSMSQTVLAELVSEKVGRRIRQNVVSDHEHGRRWADENMDLIGAYAEVLDIPPQEIHDAMRLPMVAAGPAPRDFAEIVAQDRTLSKTAKEHLLAQYELLQMATEHERRGESVLRGSPVRKRA